MRDLDPGEIEQVGRAVYEALEGYVDDQVVIRDEDGDYEGRTRGIDLSSEARNANHRGLGYSLTKALEYAGLEVRRATR